MSRIGKKPVPVPKGVTANVEGQTVSAKGPKGELAVALGDQVAVAMTDGGVDGRAARRDEAGARALGHVAHAGAEHLRRRDRRASRRSWRSAASAIARRCRARTCSLALGYSHEVNYPIPDGIKIADAEADRDRRLRHRQAEGRPGGGGNPPLAAAGALQGQGREIRRASTSSARKARRSRSSDGYEETRSDPPRDARAQGAEEGGGRASAAVGLPLVGSTSMRR